MREHRYSEEQTQTNLKHGVLKRRYIPSSIPSIYLFYFFHHLSPLCHLLPPTPTFYIWVKLLDEQYTKLELAESQFIIFQNCKSNTHSAQTGDSCEERRSHVYLGNVVTPSAYLSSNGKCLIKTQGTWGVKWQRVKPYATREKESWKIWRRLVSLVWLRHPLSVLPTHAVYPSACIYNWYPELPERGPWPWHKWGHQAGIQICVE